MPLHVRSAGPAPVVQNFGGVLNQPGVFLSLDCRVGLGRVALAFADGVDPVQRLGVLGLAHEEQVVIVAEDIPDLVDPSADQLDLILEVLPLRGMCRPARADLAAGSRSDLHEGHELHHPAHLQAW